MKMREISSEEVEQQALIDYVYQICMRDGTTEYSIPILFSPAMQAYTPLASGSISTPNFPVPLSIFYGEDDWVLNTDEDSGL